MRSSLLTLAALALLASPLLLPTTFAQDSDDANVAESTFEDSVASVHPVTLSILSLVNVCLSFSNRFLGRFPCFFRIAVCFSPHDTCRWEVCWQPAVCFLSLSLFLSPFLCFIVC